MEVKIDPAVISTLGVLVSAIGALALYIKSLHKHHTIAQKENLVTMTKAMIENSAATQSNTEVMKEMKTLLHQINIQQIKDGN